MRDKPKEKFFVSKQLLYSGLIALPTNTSVKVSVGRVWVMCWIWILK